MALAERGSDEGCLRPNNNEPTIPRAKVLHFSHARDGAAAGRREARLRGAARAPAGAGRSQTAGRGLRRLPHRSACRRRRIAEPQAADRAGARDRRQGRGGRPRRDADALARGSARPGSATPAAIAAIASAGARICATRRCSMATRATAASPAMSSSTPPTPFRSPNSLDPVAAAPLLCAGLIGWRSLKAAGEAERIGIYGFGAAAHIVAQLCRWQGRRVFAFTRDGDTASQKFALSLDAEWAGGSSEAPPEPLDAAIIFAPVGALVPAALAAVAKGGRVVCGGIHMSDIPVFPLFAAVGRAQRRLRRQSDARGRLRAAGTRRAGGRADDDAGLSAGSGQRGAGRFARGTAGRRGGADAVEQIPRKLTDFRDQNLLQHIDIARFLIARTIPSELKARKRARAREGP